MPLPSSSSSSFFSLQSIHRRLTCVPECIYIDNYNISVFADANAIKQNSCVQDYIIKWRLHLSFLFKNRIWILKHWSLRVMDGKFLHWQFLPMRYNISKNMLYENLAISQEHDLSMKMFDGLSPCQRYGNSQPNNSCVKLLIKFVIRKESRRKL